MTCWKKEKAQGQKLKQWLVMLGVRMQEGIDYKLTGTLYYDYGGTRVSIQLLKLSELLRLKGWILLC